MSEAARADVLRLTGSYLASGVGGTEQDWVGICPFLVRPWVPSLPQFAQFPSFPLCSGVGGVGLEGLEGPSCSGLGPG